MRTSARGFTLIEVLIATAIFALISVAVILIYQRSTVTVRQGIDESAAQRNARLGFEKLTTDLRMAGFDFDRDGDPSRELPDVWKSSTFYLAGTRARSTGPQENLIFTAVNSGSSGAAEPQWPRQGDQNIADGPLIWEPAPAGPFQQPDEQIEYAGPGAMTFRANFDFETSAEQNNGRERDSESPQFPLVTTGNDEIVTYALRAADPDRNVDSITLHLDMNDRSSPPARAAYPGGRTERMAVITGVDLSNRNPPYTLFRFTFDGSGNPVASPIAQNIRSLRFQYFEDAAATRQLRNPAGGRRGDGASVLGRGTFEDSRPWEESPERLARARIRGVRVHLVAMTTQADPHYRDTDPVPAARPYRKFTFESLVTPRNLGKRGETDRSAHLTQLAVINR